MQGYLQVKHVIAVANGSIALQLLYKALALEGEIITTPFSFVATASTIKWLGLTPVFVDIDEKSFNINVDNIENKITSKTSAIVATHIFGNPCHTKKIEAIAKKHNLKVIYDGAHAFGVQQQHTNLFSNGDATALSFHATKIFSTVEGGAIATNDDNLAKQLRQIINFGQDENGDIVALGINAKMNEFEAAFGLSMFPEIDKIIKRKKDIYQRYIDELDEFIQSQYFCASIQRNYIYAPFIFHSTEQVSAIIHALNEHNIFPKQYFLPALSSLNFLNNNQSTPIAKKVAERILCLPSYFDLSDEQISKICSIIRSAT